MQKKSLYYLSQLLVIFSFLNWLCPNYLFATNKNYCAELFFESTQNQNLNFSKWARLKASMPLFLSSQFSSLNRESTKVDNSVWIEISPELEKAVHKIDYREISKGRGPDRHFTMPRKNGTGYLKIGYLRGNEIGFIKDIIPLVKSGEITTIDAGTIVGPKAIPLMLKVAQLAPRETHMRFKGFITGSQLLNKFRSETQLDPSENRFFNWNQNEIAQFEKALDEIKIEEACLKLFNLTLEQCPMLEFSFDTQDIDSIRWTIPNF